MAAQSLDGGASTVGIWSLAVHNVGASKFAFVGAWIVICLNVEGTRHGHSDIRFWEGLVIK